MKIKKIITLTMVVLLVITAFAGCGNNNENTAELSTETSEKTVEKVTVNVGILKGPTGMGCAYLWKESKENKTENNYNFSLETDASVMASKLISGEYDIVAIPSNAAATLYNKSQGKIQIVAINTLGVLHILAKDGVNINSVEDLKGKTILSSGQGSVPEYVLNYILEKNGLTVNEDVTVNYATEHSEVVANALQGKADIVLLPEPFVTQLQAKDSSFKEVIDITEEWGKVNDNELAMGVFAVRKDFADNNGDAVQIFINEYENSQNKINGDVNTAASVVEECDILSSEIAKSAIPNSNIVCISGSEMKSVLDDFYSVLYEYNNASVGGSIPDAGAYFNAE